MVITKKRVVLTQRNYKKHIKDMWVLYNKYDVSQNRLCHQYGISKQVVKDVVSARTKTEAVRRFLMGIMAYE